MRGVLKACLAVLLATVGGFLFFTASAWAAEGIDLTTSPLPINITAAPGTTVYTDVRVKNESANTQKIRVSLMKFSAFGDTGQPALQDRGPGDDYFDWVSFSPQTFYAPTNQWETTRMRIDVPKDAGFGYYYAVVFSPDTGKPKGKHGNVLKGSSAVLVLLDAQNPNATKSLEVTSFSVNKHVFEFLPADFTIKFHNSGNIHVVPHGTIFISKGSKEIGQLQLNTAQGNVLPGTNRVFTTSWTDGFPVYVDKQAGGRTILDKNGKPERHLSWDFSKLSHLRFGHYTAHLTAVYDNGKQDVPIDASVRFWVIPWRIIFGFLIVFGLIGWSLWNSIIKPVRLRAKNARGAKS